MKTLLKQFLNVNIALILFSLGTQTGLALGNNINNCSSEFPKTWEVQSGDWISKLVLATYEAYGREVSQDQLVEKSNIVAQASGIENPNLIHIGDKLSIPCLWQEKKVANEFKVPERYEIRKEIASSWIASEPPTLNLVPPTELAYMAVPTFALVQPSEPVSPQEPVLEAVATWPGENIPKNSLEASLAKTPSVSAVSKPKPTAKTPKAEMNYQVVVHIPEGALNGLEEGTFPAQLVENQDKHGRWQRRQEMTVQVTKEVVRDEKLNERIIYHCFVVTEENLDKKPGNNFSVAIDFGNGVEPIQIASTYLRHGEMNQVAKLVKKKNKAYKTLNAFFPKQPNLVKAILWNPIRPFIPVATQSAIAFGTGNYPALGYIALNLARGKLENAAMRPTKTIEEQPPSHVQYALASEAEQISQLAQEVESLKVKLDFMLRQQQNESTVREGQGGK